MQTDGKRKGTEPNGDSDGEGSSSEDASKSRNLKNRDPERLERNASISSQVRLEIERKSIHREFLARHVLMMSPSYLNSLLGGARLWDELPPEKMRPLAKFLGIPMISLQHQLGLIFVEDLMAPHDHGAMVIMQKASLEKMRRDPMISAYVPNDAQWEFTPEDVRSLIMFAYEQFWMLRMRSLIHTAGGDFHALDISLITPRPTEAEFDAVVDAFKPQAGDKP